MDNLSYVYNTNSNQLKDVNESGNDSYGFKETYSGDTAYPYDGNGNMSRDEHKGIDTIIYNHLDLPVSIATSSQSIEFTYDASGTLLKKVHKNGSTPVETRDYIAGIEYINSAIDAIYHSEGRVNYVNGTPRYEYYISDHLGNNRILYCDLN
jgi:hypothetical protein